MKRIIASISFLCYFVVTTGIVINSHYCMNSLVSVHLFETSSDVCDNCGMDTHNSNGCCKDEVKVLKVEQDQNKIAATIFDFTLIQPIETFPSEYLSASIYKVADRRHFHNYSPPFLSAQDTYLQINVFRI